tara:strand:+ start:653 stop:1657 length:1005 start_codon:yes stop_codon:yes gene_type:complete
LKFFEYEDNLNQLFSEEIDLLKSGNENLKFLLIGAKGFIGSHLVEYFFPKFLEFNLNFELYIITRTSYYQCLFNGNKTYWKLIEEIPIGITHVFHLAVSSVPKSLNEFEKVELESYFNTRKKIDEICFKNRPHFIYLSSGSIFGRDLIKKSFNKKKDNCIESLFKEDPYTCLKNLDESHFYLKSKLLKYPFVLINLYNVLLPNQLSRPHFAISQFIYSAVNSQKIVVKSPQTLRSYIGLQEIMLAFLLASNSKKNFLRFSLGSPIPISMIDLAECVANFYGKSDVIVEDIKESSEYSIYHPEQFEIHRNLLLILKINPFNYISGLLKNIRTNKF